LTIRQGRAGDAEGGAVGQSIGALLLGSDAVGLVEEKIRSLQDDFDAWRSPLVH
jgi:hypothetical protein